jgi:hypothetical protein
MLHVQKLVQCDLGERCTRASYSKGCVLPLRVCAAAAEQASSLNSVLEAHIAQPRRHGRFKINNRGGRCCPVRDQTEGCLLLPELPLRCDLARDYVLCSCRLLGRAKHYRDIKVYLCAERILARGVTTPTGVLQLATLSVVVHSARLYDNLRISC